MAVDKLSRDTEGSDLYAPPPADQQYGGQGTCTDVDATQFDTTLAEQEAALKQVEKNRDRKKVAQALSSAPTPRVHNPSPMLGIGSMVQVSDPPMYGVLQWIGGELPNAKGHIAGLELVNLLLLSAKLACYSHDVHVVCLCCAGGAHEGM